MEKVIPTKDFKWQINGKAVAFIKGVEQDCPTDIAVQMFEHNYAEPVNKVKEEVNVKEVKAVEAVEENKAIESVSEKKKKPAKKTTKKKSSTKA